MRTLLLSTLLLFTVSTSWANEKLYNKLNKLYLTDRSKCMEQSKKVMTKKKHEAIPYYFVSVIHYDKSKESQNLRGTFLQLSRSAVNASKFEKLSGDQERDLVHWDEHIASLHNRAEKLIVVLNKNQMNDLSQQLIENLSKVESLASHYTIEKEVDLLEKEVVEIPKTADKNTTNFVKVEGHFYGMPTGKETVTSASVSSEKELFELINKERARLLMPALVWNEELAIASRYHAYDQGTQGYFNHTSYDRINDELVKVGSTFERVRRFYKGNPAGECIAGGNKNPKATLEQWMNSEGHSKIVLDAGSRFVGIGFVQVEGSPHEYYWVLVTGE